MPNEANVIASGNLATARRTIVGVLGQMDFLRIGEDRAVEILTGVGLPARAYDEPDFPLSFEQEIAIIAAMLRELGPDTSPIAFLVSVAQRIGITSFGVVGLTMQHAASFAEALNVSLAYPQLIWGHARLVITQTPASVEATFSMPLPERPDATAEENERLLEYCLTLDLISVQRIVADIMGDAIAPIRITLPFEEPADWSSARDLAPCPVLFAADAATLVYPGEVAAAKPLKAARLAFRTYERVSRNLSLMLADEISLAERVTRWLWAYTPPLKRGEIAKILAMSERSLARQLQAEGASYNRLFAHVQEERAKNLLKNPALSVSDVGYRLGYAEPAAFTRAFTGWTGMAPSAWRNADAAGP